VFEEVEGGQRSHIDVIEAVSCCSKGDAYVAVGKEMRFRQLRHNFGRLSGLREAAECRRPLITPLANLKSKPKHRVFSKNYELDFIDYTYNGRDSIGEHAASVGHDSTLIGGLAAPRTAPKPRQKM
jgi:hypothetical protein